MTKDPAVLFYTADFITGTFTMTDAQRGQYILLLCLQHQKGYLTEKDMLNICKTYDEDIYCKFIVKDGKYYNERMKYESDKRKKYSESRRKNRSITDESNKKVKKENNISITYDKHMVNENENINENIIKDESKKIPPKIEDVILYCKERNNGVDPDRWFNFYSAKGWLIGKAKMKDWKAAVRTWENKSNERQKPKLAM